MSRRATSVDEGRARTSARATPSPRPSASAPPRRRLRRLTKWLVGVGLAVTVVAFGLQWVLHESYFRVQHVTFVGLRHESRGAALAATGLGARPPMIDVSAAAVRHDLDVFPWIDHVTLVKHWPNTVVVDVEEARAVAVAFDARHQLQYVSAAGRDLGPAPARADLPTLTYLDPRASTWPFAHAGRAGAYVASRLPRAFSSQVSVVTVDAKGDVTLRLTTPVTFVLGPATGLHAKFVAVASVIAHYTLVPGDVVDVTVPDELAVTPPAGS